MLTSEFQKSSRSQFRGECLAARIDGDGGVELQDTVNPDRILGLPSAEWVALLRDHGRMSMS